ncbi:MAG: hypothetical protein KatS3mg104_1043 [Phycisphaerae bacterium]|nr:MAG: hypothetical protein KatS3mg104_1043 [Phycisphaerae bacterium]
MKSSAKKLNWPTARQSKAKPFSTHRTSSGARNNAQPYQTRDLIRKDMCLHFGAFITESSGHLSEYLPYYPQK